MIVVVDTNVLVSAMIQPLGNPARIVQYLLRESAAGSATWVASPAILDEYHRVLERPRLVEKYPRFSAEAQRLLFALEDALEVVAVPPQGVPGVTDPGDFPFAATARTASADYLVTGNGSHYPDTLGKVMVISPADFMTIVGLRES